MVRLKDAHACMEGFSLSMEFQFQYGAIKSGAGLQSASLTFEFQFQYSFNRTILELKSKNSAKCTLTVNLLIAPYWN